MSLEPTFSVAEYNGEKIVSVKNTVLSECEKLLFSKHSNRSNVSLSLLSGNLYYKNSKEQVDLHRRSIYGSSVCKHGVQALERELKISDFACSSSQILLIDSVGRFWIADVRSFETDEIIVVKSLSSQLNGLAVKKIVAGKYHFLLLVHTRPEQRNVIKYRGSVEEQELISSNCYKCEDQRELRLSRLMKEADMEACSLSRASTMEIDSLQPSSSTYSDNDSTTPTNEECESISTNNPSHLCATTRQASQYFNPNCYEVWSFGDNADGQLGTGDFNSRGSPTHLHVLDHSCVVDISAGDSHSAAVTAHGELFTWGSHIGNLGVSKVCNHLPLRQQLGAHTYVCDLISVGDELYTIGVLEGKPPLLLKLSRNSEKPSIDGISIEESTAPCSLFCSENKLQFILIHNFEMNTYRIFFTLVKFAKMLSNFSLAIKQLAEIQPVSNLDHLQHWANSIFKLYCETIRISEQFIFCLRSPSNTNSLLAILASSSLTKYLKESIETFSSVNGMGLLNFLSKRTDDILCSLTIEYGGLQENATLEDIFKAVVEILKQLSIPMRDLLDKALQRDLNYGLFDSTLQEWNCLHTKLLKRIDDSLNTKEFRNNNPNLELFLSSGRLVRNSYLVGESHCISRITIQKPRYYINPSIKRIIIFDDLLIIEDNSKKALHCLPLLLTWIEIVQEEHSTLQLIAPETELTIVFSEDDKQENFISECTSWWNHEPMSAPVVRSGRYEFSKTCYREKLRGATYCGKWKKCLFHGSGQLMFSSGELHTGCFNEGILQGFGEIEIPHQSNSSFYVGSEVLARNCDVFRGFFENGVLQGLAHIRYHDDKIFDGYVLNQSPHGFGILKNGRETYVGEFSGGDCFGYGVWTNGKEARIGFMKNMELNGRGVMVSIDNIMAEGEWTNGMLKRGKLFAMSSKERQSVEFEGDFLAGKHDQVGELGDGILRLANVQMTGSFSGNIISGTAKAVNAKIELLLNNVKIEEQINRETPLTLSEWAIPLNQRWRALFDGFKRIELRFEGTSLDPDCQATSSVWSAITLGTETRTFLKSENLLPDILQKVPDYDMEWSSAYWQMVEGYWGEAIKEKRHPLCRLLESVVEAYTLSYSNCAAHRKMFANAVLEARYMVDEMYKILRILFPRLPESAWSAQSSARNSDATEGNCSPMEIQVPVNDFINRAFLAKCSPTLFMMYCLTSEELDAKYLPNLSFLNAHSDVKLLSHLGVPQGLWPVDLPTDNSAVVNNVRYKFYSRAIEVLQRLPSVADPISKLRLLQDTQRAMDQCVREQAEDGKKHIWSADSLMPAFTYVVVRAQIPRLASEILFLDDFRSNFDDYGAFLLMNLKGAYIVICENTGAL